MARKVSRGQQFPFTQNTLNSDSLRLYGRYFQELKVNHQCGNALTLDKDEKGIRYRLLQEVAKEGGDDPYSLERKWQCVILYRSQGKLLLSLYSL